MSTTAVSATYRCTLCGGHWSYDAVRFLARCRDCGGGLVREAPSHGEGGIRTLDGALNPILP
jgi:hypothetical protein